MIVTARPGERDFVPLGDEIRLGPLPADVIRTIAIEATAATPLRPDELEAVVAKADGSPLFLSEILKVLRETGSLDDLPESIEAIVYGGRSTHSDHFLERSCGTRRCWDAVSDVLCSTSFSTPRMFPSMPQR